MRGVCKTWNAACEGSITRIRVELPSYQAEALPHMLRFDRLRSLSLMGNLAGLGLFRLKNSGVQILDVSKCSGVSVEFLSSFEGASLTELNLGETDVSDAGLVTLQGLPDLKTLYLNGFDWHRVTPVGIQAVRDLPITTFEVSGRRMKEEEYPEGSDDGYGNASRDEVDFDFSCLNVLKGMPLTHLFVDHSDLRSEKDLSYLEGMPLTNLSLKGSGWITDDAISFLEGMPLKSLCLNFYEAGYGEDSFGVTTLGCEVLGGVSSLESLSLFRSCCVTNEGLEVLRCLPLTCLEFDSRNNNITDTGIQCLREVPLTHLHIRSCYKISDAGILHLRGLPLTYLHLIGCGMITDEGIADLRAGLSLLDNLSTEGFGMYEVGGEEIIRGISNDMIQKDHASRFLMPVDD